MPKSRKNDNTLSFLTRRQLAAVLKVPQRIVDQLIATGQITPVRMSLGIGRGGQRVFYNSAEVKQLRLKVPRKSSKRRTGSTRSRAKAK